MKALKKEKQDEADALKRVEASLAALRKEKRDEDQQLRKRRRTAKNWSLNAANLHALCTSLLEQLKPLVKDTKRFPPSPSWTRNCWKPLKKRL